MIVVHQLFEREVGYKLVFDQFGCEKFGNGEDFISWDALPRT